MLPEAKTGHPNCQAARISCPTKHARTNLPCRDNLPSIRQKDVSNLYRTLTTTTVPTKRFKRHSVPGMGHVPFLPWTRAQEAAADSSVAVLLPARNKSPAGLVRSPQLSGDSHRHSGTGHQQTNASKRNNTNHGRRIGREHRSGGMPETRILRCLRRHPAAGSWNVGWGFRRKQLPTHCELTLLDRCQSPCCN